MDQSENSTAGKTPETELSTFLSEFSLEEVPQGGIETAERSFVDTIAVAIAGSQDTAGRRAIETVKLQSGTGDARILGTNVQVPEIDATFASSVAAHSLDFDDDQFEITSHPSASMIPPILMIAETHPISGEEALEAYVAGFETQYYLSQAITPSHYEHGWHATSTFGTFGAAAAVGNLLNLNQQQMKHALNIAASMPAGTYENFGTMTKPMHAGQAARSGVTAALLAEQGFTASPTAISGEKGFFELYSGPAGVDLNALPSLGERWAIEKNGIYVKKYPCCYATHNAIAATRELVTSKDISPESIKSIRVTASEGAAEMLTYSDPKTGAEAKFSMEYVVASAACREQLGLATFEDSAVSNARVQSVRESVELNIDHDIDYTDTQATVRLRLKDANYEQTNSKTPGGPENPLTEGELFAKFQDCLTFAGVKDERLTRSLYESLTDIRTVTDVSRILGDIPRL